jgi:hypothetical protein
LRQNRFVIWRFLVVGKGKKAVKVWLPCKNGKLIIILRTNFFDYK